jgi:hypothetical protein
MQAEQANSTSAPAVESTQPFRLPRSIYPPPDPLWNPPPDLQAQIVTALTADDWEPWPQIEPPSSTAHRVLGFLILSLVSVAIADAVELGGNCPVESIEEKINRQFRGVVR